MGMNEISIPIFSSCRLDWVYKFHQLYARIATRESWMSSWSKRRCLWEERCFSLCKKEIYFMFYYWFFMYLGPWISPRKESSRKYSFELCWEEKCPKGNRWIYSKEDPSTCHVLGMLKVTFSYSHFFFLCFCFETLLDCYFTYSRIHFISLYLHPYICLH